jgi:hypothetical protein
MGMNVSFFIDTINYRSIDKLQGGGVKFSFDDLNQKRILSVIYRLINKLRSPEN